ncbi:MAG TPA: polysaccharide lyase family 7 protein, partial [Actinophytocola sp.]|nr:polysaccharide lyase family 7 protein [Actinophytocola sp.]
MRASPSSIAVLVCALGAGGAWAINPADLTSPLQPPAPASSSSTAPPTTYLDLQHVAATTKTTPPATTTARAVAAPSCAPTTTQPTTTTRPTTTTQPTTTTRPPTTTSTPPGTALPSTVLDLSNWYLTLPTGKSGSPDTVYQPKLDTYTSTAFRLNSAENGVVFTATAGGVTTSGSKYPRSELREMTGDRKAGWTNKSGTHTLVARQAITKLPPVKPELVSAQIHDGSDDVMQVRLEGKRLMAQYNDGQSEITIDPAYALGTVFEVRIVAANSRVQVYYNG